MQTVCDTKTIVSHCICFLVNALELNDHVLITKCLLLHQQRVTDVIVFYNVQCRLALCTGISTSTVLILEMLRICITVAITRKF